MWKTIKYTKKGRPLIDVNEQGRFYSYWTRSLLKLKANRTEHPYLCWVDTDNKTRYAHIEVAKAFPEICGKWFNGCAVHHKDGNSLNNDATNLQVCTPEEHRRIHIEMREREKKKKERTLDEKKTLYTNAKRVKVYCRASKKRADGYAPIEVSVTVNKKRTFFNTGFFAIPEDFNEKEKQSLLDHLTRIYQTNKPPTI